MARDVAGALVLGSIAVGWILALGANRLFGVPYAAAAHLAAASIGIAVVGARVATAVIVKGVEETDPRRVLLGLGLRFGLAAGLLLCLGLLVIPDRADEFLLTGVVFYLIALTAETALLYRATLRHQNDGS